MTLIISKSQCSKCKGEFWALLTFDLCYDCAMKEMLGVKE